MTLVTSRNILNYKLESVLGSPERGVAIRREMLSSKLPNHSALTFLPYKDYDYSKVLAAFERSLSAVRGATTLASKCCFIAVKKIKV